LTIGDVGPRQEGPSVVVTEEQVVIDEWISRVGIVDLLPIIWRRDVCSSSSGFLFDLGKYGAKSLALKKAVLFCGG